MEFQNAKVMKKANVYFDGKVTSRTIFLETGERKTLGFMLQGDYEFETAAEELMEVLGGDMQIMQKDETEYTTYKEGESFIVPANSSFKVKVERYADYCCSYRA